MAGDNDGSGSTKSFTSVPLLNKAKSYELWKKELLLWNKITDLPKKKIGITVALSLPEDCQFGKDIRSSVLENIKSDTLEGENGMESITNYLDSILGKDEAVDKFDRFKDFVFCKKTAEESIDEYIRKFDSAVSRLKATGQEMDSVIITFMLLLNSNLGRMEVSLIMSRIDFEKTNVRVFESAKKQMRQTFGNHVASTEAPVSEGVNIKSEPVFVAQEPQHEAYATYAYRGNAQRGGYRGRGQFRGRGGQGKSTGNFGGRPSYGDGKSQQNYNKSYIKKNPLGKDGYPLRCRTCESTMHFNKECPHKTENVHATEAADTQNNEFVLFSSDEQMKLESDPEVMSQFTAEAINCAALDTCCTSSVAGERWLKIFISGLPENMKVMVKGPSKGMKKFQFGNLGILHSLGQYTIPAIIAGELDFLCIDVIKSDIPLLMSKTDMKKRGMILNLPDNKVTFKGKNKTEDLGMTSAGHYILPLIQNTQGVYSMEEVCAVDLKNCTETECKKALVKLHKQFGHRPKKCFVDLLKNANAWKTEMDKILDEIIDGCEGCILRKRSPDRPAVAMPMASDFNEKVAIDLKKWKGGYLLYMIDMFTRYTQAVFINRKTPEEVVNAIMERWVAIFGTPGAILNDNGGEFVNAELQALKSELNVVDLTTGAESPWQNGLCEKNHYTMDNILERIETDYSKLSVNAKIAWATMAKNSLMMVYGYSPFQLVFGQNPRLPNILTDGPPGWEESTVSDKLKMHLQTLHKSRQAFIESESSVRIKRALKAKIRCADINLNPGDFVYYVREGQDKWLGPAKVMFQDGKVIFLRHGGFVIRVSANRLIKVGDELAKQINKNNELITDKDDQEINSQTTEISREDRAPLIMIEKSTEHSVNNETIDRTEDTQDRIEEVLNKTQEVVEDEEDTRGEKRKPEKELTPYKAVKQNRVEIRCNDRIKVRSDDGKWSEATVLSRGGKATGKYDGYYNVEWEESAERECINLKDIEYEKIPDTPEEIHAVMVPKHRQKDPDCLKAKEEELSKLKDFGTYSVVKDVGQYRISTTWVVCQKESGVKARLVARGYEEIADVPSDSPTMNKSSLRMILALAASKNWLLETTDIKSAFLQGDKINREVFVKPPREAKLDKGYLWRLEKCLYGLCDASKMWYTRIKTSLLRLGFEISKLDPAVFYYKNKKNEIIGLVGVHVDDFIHCGSDSFNKYVILPLMEEFKVGKNEKGSFMYTGFKITQDSDGIVLDQTDYVKNLEVVDIEPARAREKDSPLTEGELTDLRKSVGAINWIVRATRPDLSFDLIDLSTKFKCGKVEDLNRARKIIINLKASNCKIFFPKLDIKSARILVYTDASFGNVSNGTGSVGGQLIFLTDKNKSVALLDWHSGKVKRVVRSTLAAETLSLVEGLESAIYHRVLMSELSGKNTESFVIDAIIDNKSCVEALRSTSQIDDKRLRIEMGEIKELLHDRVIKEVSWVDGSAQIADCLTKKGASGLLLQQIIQKGMI